MASEQEKQDAFEEKMQKLLDDPYIGPHMKLGSLESILKFQIPRMRYLSDNISNVWVKMFYRQYLNDLEATLNKNGIKLETKIKDLKYK